MKPVLTFEFHILLRLRAEYPRYKSFAEAAPPVMIGLPLRILFRGRFPSHHSDLGLAEPSMCPCLVQSEPSHPLLFILCVFFIVRFVFLILHLLHLLLFGCDLHRFSCWLHLLDLFFLHGRLFQDLRWRRTGLADHFNQLLFRRLCFLEYRFAGTYFLF